MIHIISGIQAAKNLESAFELDENLSGELIILKDTLGIGDIQSTPEINHDEIRTAFWKMMNPTMTEEIDDEKIVLKIIDKALQEEEPICFWLAPNVNDVCAYYWLLQLFKPYPSLLHTINIIGLPFLNEKGQLFYPNNFSQVPPKEFIKTKRLLKEITPSEYELEIDEWKKMQTENSWVRIYEGGKKIISKRNHYYDHVLESAVTEESQKSSKIINETMKKITQNLSPLFIEYRFRQMLQEGKFTYSGNLDGLLKDIEVKINKEQIDETVSTEVN